VLWLMVVAVLGMSATSFWLGFGYAYHGLNQRIAKVSDLQVQALTQIHRAKFEYEAALEAKLKYEAKMGKLPSMRLIVDEKVGKDEWWVVDTSRLPTGVGKSVSDQLEGEHKASK
jgi:hypothetical protein